MNQENKLIELLQKKILILDGAMGTMIQRENLKENDFRGDTFANTKINLSGNNDILNITKKEVIHKIHMLYLESGADIIETNTFNSTMISQKDYNCEDYSYELNYQGGMIAREAVNDYLKKNPDEQKFVAGVLGPTNRTCSMSPDVNDPGFRNINFDELKNDYILSMEALIKGGSDLIFIETIFDTLNCKAALMALYELEKKLKRKIPLMLSVTITDLSGRTLSGQTLEAFYFSIKHSNPVSVGLNCALGPKELESHVVELSRISEFFVSVHSNAGLPNAFGEYDESAESLASYAKSWGENGYLNIIGGCCGTTPEHIQAMKKITLDLKPRIPNSSYERFELSGLEKFTV